MIGSRKLLLLGLLIVVIYAKPCLAMLCGEGQEVIGVEAIAEAGYERAQGLQLPKFRDVQRAKSVSPEQAPAFEQARKRLAAISQLAAKDPVTAMDQLKQIEIPGGASFAFSQPVLLPGHVVENIVNSNHFKVFIDKRMKKAEGTYFYDPNDRTIHIPSQILVQNLDGSTRPLNPKNYWEKQIAEFYARANIEEVVHAHQYAFTKEGEYTTLTNPEVFDRYVAWLNKNEAHVREYLGAQAATPAVMLTLARVSDSVILNFLDRPKEIGNIFRKAHDYLVKDWRKLVESEMQELDIVLWMKENGIPMRDHQIGYHALTRPLFMEFLKEEGL